MTDTIASLQAIIGADTSGLQAGLNSTKRMLEGASVSMRQAGAALTAGLTLPIIGFLTASVKAASDNQTAMVDLNTAIKNAGATTGVTVAMAEKLAESLSRVTRFSKDTILESETLLATFKNISAKTFPEAEKAAQDMATVLKIDLGSATKELALALDSPEKGLTRLSRAGVIFTEAQKEQIKHMIKAGDLFGAQRIILDQVEGRFRGAAAAAGTTFAGQLDILNHSFTDFQEKVGYIIIPILESFMSHITDLVTGLNNLNPNILRVGIVAGVALAALGPILGILGSLGAVIGVILSPIGLLVAAIAGLGVVIGLALTGQLPEFLKHLQSFVSDLVGKIGQFVVTNAPKVVKGFEDLLGKVGDWLSDGGLGKLVLGLGDLIFNAAKWFSTDGWTLLKNGISDLFGSIQLFLGSNGWIKFRDGLLSVIKQAGDWVINTGWPILKDSVSKLVDLIIAEFQRITQGIVNAITAGVNNARSAITGQGGTGTPGAPGTSLGQTVINSIVPGLGTGLGVLFPGFAEGGPVGEAGGIVHSGEYVVPRGGALVSGGGGPDTVHIILQADGFSQHLYARIAGAMMAGSS